MSNASASHEGPSLPVGIPAKGAPLPRSLPILPIGPALAQTGKDMRRMPGLLSRGPVTREAFLQPPAGARRYERGDGRCSTLGGILMLLPTARREKLTVQE